MSHDTGPARGLVVELALFSALPLQAALPFRVSDDITSAASEINLLLASAILGLFVTLVIGAAQSAGAVSVNFARWLLAAAWLVTAVGAATSLNNAPLGDRLLTLAVVGVPVGSALILFERWLVRKTGKSEPQPPAPNNEGENNLTGRQEQTPPPNLVRNIIADIPAHQDRGLLVEDHVGGDSDVFLYGVKISNELDPSRKVGSLTDVSAEISYAYADGKTIKVLRGSWLSERRYRVNFSLNDYHYLIIAGIPRHITPGAQLVFYPRRESDVSDSVVDKSGPLDGESYQVKIRLINEAEGVLYREFDYRLTITRDPVFRIDLVEDQQGVLRAEEVKEPELTFDVDHIEVSARIKHDEINVCGDVQFDNAVGQTLTVKQLSLALHERRPAREVARARLLHFGKKNTLERLDMTRGIPVEGGRLSEVYSFMFTIPLHGAIIQTLDSRQFLRFAMAAQKQKSHDKDIDVDWDAARENRKCGPVTFG